MKLKLTMFLLCGIIVSASAQQELLSISAKADSLMESLIASSGKVNEQYSLVEEYLAKTYPELALLELLEIERNNKLTAEGLFQKARILFLLGHTKIAERELARSYLLHPTPDKLKYLIATDYLLGNSSRSKTNYQYMHGEYHNAGLEFVKFAKEFYASDRNALATSILGMLKTYEPDLYAKHFPLPVLSILSPEKNYTTDEAQQVVTFQISHTRPITMVNINDVPLVKIELKAGLNESESYSKTFTYKAPVAAGKNTFVIKVADMYGYQSSDSISMYGLGFNLPVVKKSPVLDTLKSRTEYLGSFIPEKELQTAHVNEYKLLSVIADNSADSIKSFSHAYLWNKILCNNFTGYTNESEVKFLSGRNAETENIDAITAGWLRKKVNFVSKLVFWFSGSWAIDNSYWNLKTISGNNYDVKFLLKSFTQTASSGLYIVINGVKDVDEFTRQAQIFAAESKVPVTFILPRSNFSPDSVVAKLTFADTTITQNDEVAITSKNLGVFLPAVIVTSPEAPQYPLFHAPGQAAYFGHKQLLSSLSLRLKDEKITPEQKMEIETYCADWRRNNELRRYLSNQLSIADLVIRVEEYLGRTSSSEVIQ